MVLTSAFANASKHNQPTTCPSFQRLCYAFIFISLLYLGVFRANVVGQTPPTAQFLGKPINQLDIKLNGQDNTKDEQDAIKDIININIGQEYTAPRIREAIIKLYKSGRVLDVQVEAQLAGQGVHVTFLVTRQLRIEKVNFAGEPIFTSTELLSHIVGLDTGMRLAQPNIDRSAEQLVKFYQDAGYFQVAISPLVQPDAAQDRATINFIITPGMRAQVGNFVELDGDLKLDRDALVSTLKLQPHNLFSLADLQADIDNIRKQHINAGYLDPQIERPEISYDGDSNTVNIHISVNSGLKATIMVTGFDIKEAQLRKLLPMLQQGGLDDFTIEEGRRQLQELLQQQGFFFATIEIRRSQDAMESQIIYEVTKGLPYRVVDIRLIGTEALTTAEIIPVLKSHRAAFKSRGLTSNAFLTRDSETITNRLKELGYRQAAVEYQITPSPDKQTLIITFVVTEGARVMVDEVVFDGQTVFTADALRLALPVRKVPYLAQSRVNEDVEALLNLYSRKGYPETQITTQVTNLSDSQARLTFHVIEGDQILVNRIVVTNRGQAKDAQILKYLTVREGELLKRDDLNKSEQQLYATGAFRTVAIHSEFINYDENGRALHDLFVETAEAQPYTLIYGLGYQSEDGPRGLFQISNANFFGRLQTTTLTLRGSRREQLGQISYLFPRPFDLPVSPLLLFFYRRKEDVNFTSRRFTVSLQAERRLNETSTVAVRYAFEDIKIFNVQLSPKEILNRNDLPIKLGRVSTTFLNDSRDNIFDATKGTFTSTDLSLASVALGGDREFVRVFANHQRYRKLPTKTPMIFASNLQLGLARSFDKQARLPLTERFFAGGANTLRGFGFEKAGPRNQDGQITGGNAFFVLNSELRFPLINKLGGVLFYDTGNVFRTISNFALNQFSNTLGTGLRIATPVGPVRVDMGVLLNPQVPERRVQFHFSFGQAF